MSEVPFGIFFMSVNCEVEVPLHMIQHVLIDPEVAIKVPCGVSALVPKSVRMPCAGDFLSAGAKFDIGVACYMYIFDFHDSCN